MTMLLLLLFHLGCVHFISGKIVNEALGKPVTVSSRHPHPNGGRIDPKKAVDGITRGSWPNTIMHTDRDQPDAWFVVDLQTEVQDAEVKIYFRTDNKHMRRGVQLYTSQTPFSTYPDGESCYNVTKREGAIIPDVISVNCTGIWRYLMVYTDTDDYFEKIGPMLAFGEVEVLACSNGTYGINCDKSCSSRQCTVISASCDRYTGTCPEGCKPGWTKEDCTECSPEVYGVGCNMSCSSRHCNNPSSTCDSVTGICANGCKPGYLRRDCTQKCPSGTYGPDCNLSCGNCTGDDICDHETGNCPGDCRPGWQRPQCQQNCTDGTYGVNCAQTCGQCNVTCDIVTGYCPEGCEDGYDGATCMQKLDSSKPGTKNEDPNIAPVIAGTVAAVLLIVIVVIVVFLIMKRRRSTDSISKKSRNQSLELCNGSSDRTTADNEGGNVYANAALIGENTSTHKAQTLDKKVKSRETKSTQQLQNADPETDEENPDDDTTPSEEVYTNEHVIREITVSELDATFHKLKAKPKGFEEQYSYLPIGFTSPFDDSKKPENAGKNKFKGYYPYDHNRVRLSLLPDVPGSDYINASHMHNYNRTKRYIAAQAPNKDTFGDFWRMIWEHRCGRVIMLTGLVEEMKVKCFQYWPDNSELQTDHYQIEVEVTDIRANYTVRHIKVTSKTSNECRSVVQYHFTSWPDHGVPDNLALVHFIWMIRQTNTQLDGPLLIHCSAGIGRTGTYIAVDSLLDQARVDGVLDVLGYVSTMREQRKNMIQTKEQYECVFHCLLEMTKFGNTSMDVENFITSYSSRGMGTMVDRKTLRELTQMVAAEGHNDNPNQHRMWVDGNQDFIVRKGPTLRLLRGYLMAVVPPPGLEKLLWKLVEENSVHNLIVISQLQNAVIGKKGTTRTHGDVTMTTADQINLSSNLTMFTLQLKDASSETFRKIKFYTFAGSSTLDSMSSCLLNHAHIQHLSGEITAVVIIHSESDRKCAVLLCIMGNILSGIIEDRRVDVIGHVRTFLKCCPEVKITEKDVKELLDFAEKCVQMTSANNTYANV